MVRIMGGHQILHCQRFIFRFISEAITIFLLVIRIIQPLSLLLSSTQTFLLLVLVHLSSWKSTFSLPIDGTLHSLFSPVPTLPCADNTGEIGSSPRELVVSVKLVYVPTNFEFEHRLRSSTAVGMFDG